MSVLVSCWPSFGSASVTTVPSRKTMADPSIAAARVPRCAVVTARVYRWAARSRPRSVGMGLPEAVGAVDRSVHARPERHLGLVAALGAQHREVLARRARALVAAGSTEVGGGV